MVYIFKRQTVYFGTSFKIEGVSIVRNPGRDMHILFLSRSLYLIVRSVDIIILRERLIKSREQHNILRERLIKSRERHNILRERLIKSRVRHISRGNDIIFRGNDLLSRRSNIISWRNDFLTRGKGFIILREKVIILRGRHNYLEDFEASNGVMLTIFKWGKFGSRSAILQQYDL